MRWTNVEGTRDIVWEMDEMNEWIMKELESYSQWLGVLRILHSAAIGIDAKI